jgi:hypothetical protein
VKHGKLLATKRYRNRKIFSQKLMKETKSCCPWPLPWFFVSEHDHPEDLSFPRVAAILAGKPVIVNLNHSPPARRAGDFRLLE